jgi:hypothetical protein
LTNAGLVTINQSIGDRVDALHACDKDQVTRTGTNTPGIPIGADGKRNSVPTWKISFSRRDCIGATRKRRTEFS